MLLFGLGGRREGLCGETLSSVSCFDLDITWVVMMWTGAWVVRVCGRRESRTILNVVGVCC